MSRRPRLCFVAPAGYPVLAADRSIPFVGGSEVQQAFIAPELARRGYDVSMISMDFGQQEGDRVKGVRLLKMHAPSAGVPVLRFIHPRLTSLWGAMRRADADVYYQRNGGPGTGFVAHFARKYSRFMLFAAASDADFDPALTLLRLRRDKVLYRYGVRNAHRVVVQSERQRQMCLRAFGRAASRIASCYEPRGAPGSLDGPIVWVAAVKALKRPELFVELAERLPQYRFRLVGGAAAESASFNALQRRAQALGNLEMTGFVPYADVEAHFDSASLLVNTSTVEGFPNTFLQAWSRGIPTVSFFAPDVRLNGTDIGTTVADLDEMVRAVVAFKTNHSMWAERGVLAAEYFRKNHSVTKAVDDYERIFEGCIGSPATMEE